MQLMKIKMVPFNGKFQSTYIELNFIFEILQEVLAPPVPNKTRIFDKKGDAVM